MQPGAARDAHDDGLGLIVSGMTGDDGGARVLVRYIAEKAVTRDARSLFARAGGLPRVMLNSQAVSIRERADGIEVSARCGRTA